MVKNLQNSQFLKNPVFEFKLFINVVISVLRTVVKSEFSIYLLFMLFLINKQITVKTELQSYFKHLYI